MAEEELELEANKGDGGSDDGKGKSKSSKLMAIGGVAVVLAVGGGFLAYRSMSPEPEASAAEPAAAVDSAPPPAAGAAMSAAPLHLENAAVFSLEPLLVNLADTDARRLARARVELVFATEEEMTAFKDSAFAIAKAQHTALGLLRAKTSEEIELLEGQRLFCTELSEALRASVGGARVADVLLTEFIIQY